MVRPSARRRAAQRVEVRTLAWAAAATAWTVPGDTNGSEKTVVRPAALTRPASAGHLGRVGAGRRAHDQIGQAVLPGHAGEGPVGGGDGSSGADGQGALVVDAGRRHGIGEALARLGSCRRRAGWRRPGPPR